ncbi:response regulator transcription factor [Fretibacter rubidus]|uniref:response regulator transcription factor n=1 Tax=Fretibacter rubidus TaxID=570162 RepID=UPI00352B07E3
MKQALLIEDDPTIAAHVQATLERAGWSLEHYLTCQSGLSALAPHPTDTPHFDVLICDRMLPDGEGLDLVERLRARGVMTPILMLTALGNSQNRVEGYQRGADDYLTKPFEPEELVARVEALYRRAQGGLRADLRKIADLEVHVKARTAHRAGEHLKLSPKEFDLLLYFLDHEGALITRDMLLRDVWNMHFDPGTNVVDVNIGRMRRKLDGDFDISLLQTVRGFGYRFGMSDDAVTPQDKTV